MSREENLIKNTIIIALGTFLPKFAAIITLPILTAYMSKADYGMSDIIATICSLLLPMATLKIEAAAFRFIVDKRGEEKECSKIIVTMFVFASIISIFVLGIYYYIPNSMNIKVKILCCVYFYLQSIYSMLQQILRGLSKNILYSSNTISYAFFNLVLIVIFIKHFELGLVGLLYSYNISLIISIIFCTFSGKIYKYLDLRNFSFSVLKEMLLYSWPMVPNSLSLWIMNLSDRLIISKYLGNIANADYAVANKIPNLYSTMEGTFIMAWQENASIANKDSDSYIYYSKVFEGVFEILVWLIAGVMTACPIIYTLLVRGDYSTAYVQIPILFLAMFFSSISSFFGGIYVAEKKTKRVAFTTVVSALINIVVDLILINRIGLYAASISTLVSYACLAIFRMFDVNSIIPMCYNLKKEFSGIVLLIIMCCFMLINTIYFNIINGIIFLIICCTYSREIFKSFILSVRNKVKR